MQTILEDIIRIQPRGVFTLPKKLRAGLFDKNRLAKVRRVGRSLVIEPLQTLEYPVRSYKDSELEEFFELDEKESNELKAKGVL